MFKNITGVKLLGYIPPVRIMIQKYNNMTLTGAILHNEYFLLILHMYSVQTTFLNAGLYTVVLLLVLK